MSKTLLFLLVLSVVWLAAWSIAGHYMRQAGVEKVARAEYAATPATRLERGATVRVEGTIAAGPSSLAPYGQTPCLAAVTNIAATVRYRDAQNRPAADSRHIATRRVGPRALEVEVGERRLELPLERWSPVHARVEEVTKLPARLGVTDAQIARARAQLHQGYGGGFSIGETTIDAGEHVFVAGKLEDREGPLRLDTDPVLGEVLLHVGTQAEWVSAQTGSGGGLQTAGWILGLGVGPLPLALICLVLLARRRSRPSKAT